MSWAEKMLLWLKSFIFLSSGTVQINSSISVALSNLHAYNNDITMSDSAITDTYLHLWTRLSSQALRTSGIEFGSYSSNERLLLGSSVPGNYNTVSRFYDIPMSLTVMIVAYCTISTHTLPSHQFFTRLVWPPFLPWRQTGGICFQLSVVRISLFLNLYRAQKYSQGSLQEGPACWDQPSE